jgi:hypothetical protein
MNTISYRHVIALDLYNTYINICLNQLRKSVDCNPLRQLDIQRYTTCGTCQEKYDFYEVSGSYSQCRLICLSIIDIVIVTLVLNLLYISSGWGLYGMCVKDFFLPDGNKYLNIYINGIVVIQTITKLFIMILFVFVQEIWKYRR